jgi:hypothetical protein
MLTAMVWVVVACSSFSGTPTPVIADPGPDECQDRVLVVVWGDLNRDGVQDPDEPPLADVLLMMVQKDDPSGERYQLSTNADGRAHFPTRELENCRPLGYQVLFVRQVAGYEFPPEPVVDLATFDPDEDIVRFGLLPLSE